MICRKPYRSRQHDPIRRQQSRPNLEERPQGKGHAPRLQGQPECGLSRLWQGARFLGFRVEAERGRESEGARAVLEVRTEGWSTDGGRTSRRPPIRQRRNERRDSFLVEDTMTTLAA